MIRECNYCGMEYFDGELNCDECGGVIMSYKLKEEKTQQGLTYWQEKKKYNNVDNILESKRKKNKDKDLYM